MKGLYMLDSFNFPVITTFLFPWLLNKSKGFL